MTCVDCGIPQDLADLSIYCADLGEGAFIDVLCEVCWHRREYRAHLRELQAAKRRVDVTPEYIWKNQLSGGLT